MLAIVVDIYRVKSIAGYSISRSADIGYPSLQETITPQSVKIGIAGITEAIKEVIEEWQQPSSAWDAIQIQLLNIATPQPLSYLENTISSAKLGSIRNNKYGEVLDFVAKHSPEILSKTWHHIIISGPALQWSWLIEDSFLTEHFGDKYKSIDDTSTGTRFVQSINRYFQLLTFLVFCMSVEHCSLH